MPKTKVKTIRYKGKKYGRLKWKRPQATINAVERRKQGKGQRPRIKNVERYRQLRKEFDHKSSALGLPKTHTTLRGVEIKIYGRGVEVSKPVTSVKGTITKVYTPESKFYSQIPGKYRMTKALIEAGAPINEPRLRPIKDKRGERLVWNEEELGRSVQEAMHDSYPKQRERIIKKYDRAVRQLRKSVSRASGLGRYTPVDINPTHAFLTKGGKVVFSDVRFKDRREVEEYRAKLRRKQRREAEMLKKKGF